MEVKLESFDSTETDMSDIQTMSTPARTPSPVNSISSQVDYKPQILPGPGSSNLLAIPQIASYAKPTDGELRASRMNLREMHVEKTKKVSNLYKFICTVLVFCVIVPIIVVVVVISRNTDDTETTTVSPLLRKFNAKEVDALPRTCFQKRQLNDGECDWVIQHNPYCNHDKQDCSSTKECQHLVKKLREDGPSSDTCQIAVEWAKNYPQCSIPAAEFCLN